MTEAQAIHTPNPLLTVTEAARLAGVSRSTMYRLLASAPAGDPIRQIAVNLDGHHMLVRRAVLEAWLRGETYRFTTAEGTR